MKKLIIASALTATALVATSALASNFNFNADGWYGKNTQQINVEVLNKNTVVGSATIVPESPEAKIPVPNNYSTVQVQVSYGQAAGNKANEVTPKWYCAPNPYSNTQDQNIIINAPVDQQAGNPPNNFTGSPCS